MQIKENQDLSAEEKEDDQNNYSPMPDDNQFASRFWSNLLCNDKRGCKENSKQSIRSTDV